MISRVFESLPATRPSDVSLTLKNLPIDLEILMAKNVVALVLPPPKFFPSARWLVLPVAMMAGVALYVWRKRLNMALDAFQHPLEETDAGGVPPVKDD